MPKPSIGKIGAAVLAVGLVWTSAIAATLLNADLMTKAREGETAIIYQPRPATPTPAWASAAALDPLNPEIVAGLVASTVADDKAQQLSPAQLAALTGLGWQSSRVQQNLIFEAYRTGNDRMLLDRVDGMLRREKLSARILPFLFLLEQSGDATQALVRARLRDRPKWRRMFLVEALGYSTPEGVAARGRTLRAMYADGLQPTREEVAPIVIRLHEGGKLADAVDLWKRYRGITGQPTTPFDPQFAVGAQDDIERPDLVMPFDWQVASGPGFAGRLRAEGPRNGTLLIRWDGRGAPSFARQVVLSGPGMFDITVAGRLLSHNALTKVLFVADCPTSKTYFRRFNVERDNVFRFQADGLIGCPAPLLRIVGVAGDGPNSVELEFTRIELMLKAG